MINQSTEGLRIKAQKGSDALDDSGVYDINHKLSQEQIKIAALLQIDPSGQQSIDDKCYINGFSLRDHTNKSLNVAQLFNDGNPEVLNGAFNLTESINAAKAGKPAFFVVEDEGHYVTVALVPNEENPPKLSVQYFNSILGPEPELDQAKSRLETELNTNTDDDKELLRAQINNIDDTIRDQTTMASVGKNFAEALVGHLQNNGVALSHKNVLDRSVDQQLGDGCGLSVAANIAAVVNKTDLFSPKSSQEKTAFYNDMGSRVFGSIKTGYLSEAPEVAVNKVVTRPVEEDWSQEVAAIDAVHALNKQTVQRTIDQSAKSQPQADNQTFWQKIVTAINYAIEQTKKVFGFKEAATRPNIPIATNTLESRVATKPSQSAQIGNGGRGTNGSFTEKVSSSRSGRGEGSELG